MNCLHCHQPATYEGNGKSLDEARTLHFYRCRPCQAAWVVPDGGAHTLPKWHPAGTPVAAPVEVRTGNRDRWPADYFKLPPRPDRPCRACGSTRFWVPEDKPHSWLCVICVHAEEGAMQRVTEIQTKKEIENGIKAMAAVGDDGRGDANEDLIASEPGVRPAATVLPFVPKPRDAAA